MKQLVFGFVADKYLRRFLFALSLFALNPAPFDSARADDNTDAANTAVQIFVTAGQAAGLPITQDEAAIVTQIVACGVAGSNVATCVKNAAVTTVLQKAGITDPVITDAVNCLTDGTKAETCATKAVIAVAKLPPDVQPAASCMLGGGNVVDCGKKLAEGVVLDKVPAEIQPVAKCVIEGGKAQGCVTDFVTQQIVKNLPTQPVNLQTLAPQVVGCLSASNVGDCMTKAVVNLTKDQQGPLAPLISCATQSGANLGQCAATFAASNLPTLPTVGGVDPNAAAKAVVTCAGSADFNKCVTDAGVKQAKDLTNQVVNQAGLAGIQAALDTINKLKPDAPLTIDAGVDSKNIATLQNILKVADGIKHKDWGEVVMAAGPELAIVAGNILLSIFLTPAAADLLGPAVAAMIHNDAAAAQLALQAIAKGDVVALAQVVFTWYETQFIDKPCALLGKDVQDTVCGALSDAIKTISEAGGDLAKKVLAMGEDILKWIGIWGTVDSLATTAWNVVSGAIDDIGHFLGLGGGDGDKWKPAPSCGSFSPKDYFANSYLACLPAAVQRPQGTINASLANMNSACEQAFDACIAPENRGKVPSTCAAMGKSLSDLANQVSASMGTAADMYSNTLGPAAFVSAAFEKAKQDGLKWGLFKNTGIPDFCSPDFWSSAMQNSYVSQCSGFVNQQFPGMKASPAACSAIQTQAYDDRAGGSCRLSLQAALGAMQATGKNLVGPNSTFCKAQQKEIADNPCRITRTLDFPEANVFGVVDPSSIVCDPPSRRTDMPHDNPLLPLPPSGDTFKPFPGGMQRPDQVLFPPQGSSGWSGVNNNTNEGTLRTFPGGIPKPGDILLPGSSSGSNTTKATDPKIKPPILGALPKANSSGSSGVSMINGCSGNSPAAGCPPSKRQRVIRVPRGTPALVDRGPPNAGSSGSNSAMDRLGGGGMGNLDAISGNRTFTSGPAKIDVPRRPPVRTGNSSGSSGISTSKPIPGSGGGGPVKPSSSSGGSSGYSTSKAGNAGGSSGISTSRPIPSGNSGGSSGASTSRPAPAPTRPSAPRPPAPRNDPIDYGGCAGCGQKKDDLIVR
ncbi:hypothetical protein [Rhodoplanes sp. Z2-YC6860]|uniref:hypothetical protein n=1 Tax=Rhodoplanes sp. Z2-YC6860 TaxID=674703 RepID=UPI00082C9CBB|nr:hypothetical protein [Rhodoplanes sp. Z2-YC6860]